MWVLLVSTDLAVHNCPEFVDVQMLPPKAAPELEAAASFLPLLLDVIAFQDSGSPTDVHDSPESEDVQILPESGRAASLLPSLLEVIE